MTRREQWIALAGLVCTIVAAVWYLGLTLGALRADVSATRDEVEALGVRLERQIEELRGYIVAHLEDHSD